MGYMMDGLAWGHFNLKSMIKSRFFLSYWESQRIPPPMIPGFVNKFPWFRRHRATRFGNKEAQLLPDRFTRKNKH